MNIEQSERKTREVAAKLESEIRRLQRTHEADVSRHKLQIEAKDSEMNVLNQKFIARDQEAKVYRPFFFTILSLSVCVIEIIFN